MAMKVFGYAFVMVNVIHISRNIEGYLFTYSTFIAIDIWDFKI